MMHVGEVSCLDTREKRFCEKMSADRVLIEWADGGVGLRLVRAIHKPDIAHFGGIRDSCSNKRSCPWARRNRATHQRLAMRGLSLVKEEDRERKDS